MLNRMDFVKCFDLLTKQEIKNYQDSLNFVLQSIQDLKERCNDIQNHFLENHALLHSNQNDLLIENEKLREECRYSRELLERSLRDQSARNSTHSAELHSMVSAMHENEKITEDLENKFQFCSQELTKLKDALATSQRVYYDNLDDLRFRFRQEMSKCKQDILSAPTEADNVRRELKEDISTHKIDVSGLMREIQVYKADATISEKKIEHLYTLIDRLKKSQEVTP